MFNVNELTSRLAKMSDPQLRQYAQIHKDDPYTLALAAAENKRRVQLRAPGQPAGQGPQPTVAEQTLALMGAPAPMPQQAPQSQLPEEQGIGMLPAQNVAGMADGGIAGYADGGMVAFAGEGPSLVGQGFNREPLITAPTSTFNQRISNQKDLFSAQDTTAEIARLESILQNTPAGPQRAFAEQRLAQLKGQPSAPPVSSIYPDEFLRGSAASPVKPDVPTPLPAAKDKDRRTPSPQTDSPTGRRAAEKQGVAEKQATAEQTMGFIPSKPGNLTEEMTRLKALGPDAGAEYDALGRKVAEGYDKLDKEREANKPKDKAYAGLEALLSKDEEKAKGKEAKNFNMALINAGLAIAGGKSQYALQNIAEGAQVGTKQYQEGLDKLEAAAVERRKQVAMIEEARRSEARGDFKEAQAFKQKAFEAGLGIEQAKIAGVQDIFKVNVKTATDLVTSQNALASADQRAVMQEAGLNKRAAEQNASELARSKIIYGGRGGSQNIQNIVYDNATKQHQLWLTSPEGKLAAMTPGASDAKFNEFLNQAASFQGMPVPGANNANVPGGVKFLGFEK